MATSTRKSQFHTSTVFSTGFLVRDGRQLVVKSALSDNNKDRLRVLYYRIHVLFILESDYPH